MAVNKAKAFEELRAALKKIRTDAGLTVRQMGERVSASAANISNWENSRLIPMKHLVTVLDEMQVDEDERERLLGLRRQAEGPGELAAGGPSVEPLLAQLIEHEQVAQRITTFTLSALPGLLQTPEYARTIIGDAPDASVRVALRAGRRDVITRHNSPVELVALIDSEVLVRPIAPRDVMARQLRHLLEMAKLPNVTIQIVPSTVAGWHPGLHGSFVIIEFLLAEPIVHIENYRASAFLWDANDVAAYIAAVEKIEERAMTPDRTSEAIEEMLQGLETQ